MVPGGMIWEGEGKTDSQQCVGGEELLLSSFHGGTQGAQVRRFWPQGPVPWKTVSEGQGWGWFWDDSKLSRLCAPGCVSW